MAKWPSDKELEEIYRKGSDDHNFEYDPSAWEDMTVLLDKKDRRKVIFFIFLGALFLSFSALYFGAFYPSNSSINNEEIITQTISNSFVDINETTSQLNQKTSERAQETFASTTKSISSTENINKSIKYSSTEKSLANSKNSNPSKSKKTNINNNLLIPQKPLLTEGQVKNNEHLVETPNENKINPLINLIDSNNVLFNSNRILSKLPIHSFSQFATAQYLALPHLDSISIIESKDEHKSIISLFAILGAESSWTPTGEFSSIDYNLGLGINVRLRKKLGFTIGASYIRDLYIANQGDYKAKQEFWRQSEEPNYTSANCKMIELNTGLSYYFNGWDNDGIGLQVGLLSNFMLSEQYDYHFEEESMNFSSSWTGSNKTWLNAIDISPSYRFTYGRNGSIEVSPYFKIPLNGIGHGDVLLSSFGLKGKIRIF